MVVLLQYGADTAKLKDNEGKLPLDYLGDSELFDPTTTFLLLLQRMGVHFQRMN